jgi:carotenoid cleavage dioxygenase
MDTGAPHVSQALPLPPQAGYNEPVRAGEGPGMTAGWS